MNDTKNHFQRFDDDIKEFENDKKLFSILRLNKIYHFFKDPILHHYFKILFNKERN